jgi:hypothetical protein
MTSVMLAVPDIDLRSLSDEELEGLCKDNAHKENELRGFAIKAQAEKIFRWQVRHYGSVEEAAAQYPSRGRKSYKLPKLTAQTCQMCGQNLRPNELDGICSRCLPS